MADRFVCSALAALALVGITSPALAHTTRHRVTTTHHNAKPTRSSQTTKHGARHVETKAHGEPRKHGKNVAEHHVAAPGGATSVPSGGLKVYCAGHSSPLLIRKATQGAGTTVTIVCR